MSDDDRTFTEEQMADIAGTLLAMTMQMQAKQTRSATRTGEILIAKMEMLGFNRASGMAWIRRATDISKDLF